MGMKLATKFVDAEAIIINNNTIVVIFKLSNLPIISVGFVNILLISSNCWFRKTSEPTTIKTENNENVENRAVVQARGVKLMNN